MYTHGQLHSNQQQYSLRPELMESTFYLYQVQRSVTITSMSTIKMLVMVNNDNVTFAGNCVVTMAVVLILILMTMTLKHDKVMTAAFPSRIS